MSNVIWKYSFGPISNPTLSMPKGAQVIHADIQDNEFYLWAIIPEPGAPKENRYFLVAPTGGIGDSRIKKEAHISTILEPRGYVWHIFEVTYE